MAGKEEARGVKTQLYQVAWQDGKPVVIRAPINVGYASPRLAIQTEVEFLADKIAIRREQLKHLRRCGRAVLLLLEQLERGATCPSTH